MAATTTDTALIGWATYWSSHDMDQLLSLFTDDCVYEDVTLGIVNHGKGELTAFAHGFFTAFPDFHVELQSHFDTGEWAAVEWVMSGTHEGDLMGTPPTHKRFSLRGASTFELADGKIRRCSDYWDFAIFAKQLGLSVSPS
jgi:steroid delta-isomerase-like uncharacterized protein